MDKWAELSGMTSGFKAEGLAASGYWNEQLWVVCITKPLCN